MKLRRLTAAGIAQFAAYLTQLKADPLLPPPNHLLSDGDVSEPTGAEVEVDIEDKLFATRFEAGAYLDAKISALGLSAPERDAGLWAWLALHYFDQLCPKRVGTGRVVREHAQYILAVGDPRRFYRHLLCGPYAIYAANRDRPQRALVLLYGELSTVGHFVYQLASRGELLTNRAVLDAATKLYIDPQRHRPKRGSVNQGPGGVFRFAAVMNQLDLVWDLQSLSVERLLALLPNEFEKFRPRQLELGI